MQQIKSFIITIHTLKIGGYLLCSQILTVISMNTNLETNELYWHLETSDEQL